MAKMAAIFSSMVGTWIGLCCSAFSTNDGLNDGAEGLMTPDWCNELLILIGELFDGVFSILTDTSLLEFLLIKATAQVNIIIETTDAPIPMSGHFSVSNSDVAGC